MDILEFSVSPYGYHVRTLSGDQHPMNQSDVFIRNLNNLRRPSGSYYSPRSYGTTPSYSSYGSYSKPSYTPSSSKYGSSYITPSREKSVDRTGYTSDYGKSGYASDYGKSGYASDRSRVGYTSDYNAKPSTNYSSYNNPSSYGYGRSVSRQNSITGSDRLSRQNSITGSDRL
ncbi:hypothetical protein NPIL_18551, partial [Nephila pilipes]